MQNKQISIKPSEIIELILRYRWFVIVPFCLSMIVGVYFTITLPKIYSAQTMILVQPQKVPSNFVQSLVSIGISERISTIRQQILSRSNLETVIQQFKLFSEPEQAKMYEEEKIANLRKRITLHVTKARAGADAFSIEFEGKNPETVMKIANSLASFFINENLKVREAQAIGTSDFLDDQLSTMSKRLADLEETLKTYNTKHMGSLPEQLQSNLRVLDRLQLQLDAKHQNLRAAKTRLHILEKQSFEGQNTPLDLSIFTEDIMLEDDSEDSPNLQPLKEQLAGLKTRYTEKHPDVVRLKRTIAKLEEEIANQAEEVAVEETPTETPETENELPEMDYMELQKTQLNEAQREIANQEIEISKLLKQIETYQQRVEETPEREQDLLTLKRNYDNMKQAYTSLLSRKLEAEISVNMEKKQKGEQFRIVDSARLPEKPISPDVKKIFALSLAAGLGVGGALIFLLFYFDSSYREAEEIESTLGIPILAAVPTVYQPKDLKRQKLHLALSLFSIMVSFVLLAMFAVLTLKGVDKTLEFLRKFI